MGSYLPSIKKNGEQRKPPKIDDSPIYCPVDNLVGYLPSIEPEQIPDPRHTKYADVCVESARQAADDANLVKTINDEFNRKSDDVLSKLTNVDEQVERATTAAAEAEAARSVSAMYADIATTAANTSTTKATGATNSALMAEGYSVGEQNGEPVEEGSPYYHNNAKYYAAHPAPATASSVSYDGTTSEISADNVQGAIDETITKVNSKADATDIPTELADLASDATHRLVTDTEKSNWNSKASQSSVDELISIVGQANDLLEGV